MRLLVITARYPTADRPAAGTFVRERLRDPAIAATVIGPRKYGAPGWRRYASIIWRALSTRGNYDGIEGHFLLPTGAIAVAAGKLRRRPVVVYAHGTDVRVTAHRSRLNRLLARWVVGNAAAIVTNSESTAAELRAFDASATVIPPGVDLERFRPTPRPTSHKVLYLGGTTPGKGFDVARRFAHTLVGPGLTEVDPDLLPGLIAEHDIVLVPSESEGFGLVAAEAIAAGRWVVARATGGLTEVVEPGVTGTLVERDDEFAAAIAGVPDYDPNRLAARAARFDIRNQRAALAALWAGVLQAKGPDS